MPTQKTEETASAAPTAKNRYLPPNFVLPVLAELDNSESFESKLFILKKIPLGSFCIWHFFSSEATL